MKIPVTPRSPPVSIISKTEIQEGVIVAASLTKVVDGYAMTSILNTNENEVTIPEPIVELDEVNHGENDIRDTELKISNREKCILGQLKLEHLNAEEEKLFRTCSDFQRYILPTRRSPK